MDLLDAQWMIIILIVFGALCFRGVAPAWMMSLWDTLKMCIDAILSCIHWALFRLPIIVFRFATKQRIP